MTKTNSKLNTKRGFNSIKLFFANIFRRIARYFHYLSPLVMMQLKDKIDMSFLKSKRKTLFKVIYKLLMFIVLVAVIYVFFNLIVSFGIFSATIKMINFRAYLVLMTVLIILSFISCLAKVTDTLYFSRDNSVLITLPAKNSMIFTSKLIVCFIYELIKNISYILPFLLAYGLIMGLSFWFYLYSIFALLLFTILSVTLSGFLSIPTMFITALFKKNRVLELFAITILIGFGVWGIVSLISLIPADINLVRDWGKIYWSIQDFLTVFAQKLFIFDNFLQLLTGMVYMSFSFSPVTTANLQTFGICIGIIILSLILIYLLSKSLFLKMISTPFEFKKVDKKFKLQNMKRAKFLSVVIYQSKQIFRTPNIFYGLVAVAVACPIAIFLQNKIIAAMDTRILGNYMMISFNILILLLLILSTNVTMASIYSREAHSGYINKTNPVQYRTILFGKLIFNIFICTISIAISVYIINLFANIGTLPSILLAFSILLVYLANMFWSAEFDVMNPQNQQYQTTGVQQKNPNETKSTILSFATSIIFAFICFFLISEDVRVVFQKLLLIASLFFICRTILYFAKIKLYFKEK